MEQEGVLNTDVNVQVVDGGKSVVERRRTPGKQKDLAGEDANYIGKVGFDTRESITYLLWGKGFLLRANDLFLDKVQAAKPKGRLNMVRKKLRPLPDVEEIARGQKDEDAGMILAFILAGEVHQ